MEKEVKQNVLGSLMKRKHVSRKFTQSCKTKPTKTYNIVFFFISYTFMGKRESTLLFFNSLSPSLTISLLSLSLSFFLSLSLSIYLTICLSILGWGCTKNASNSHIHKIFPFLENSCEHACVHLSIHMSALQDG